MENDITGLICGIKRGAIHDGDGMRTTVFMKGCPLRCQWCHNPESLSFNAEVGYYADKCIKCRTCIETCQSNAIKLSNNRYHINKKQCNGCFDCADRCPADALIPYGEKWSVEKLVERLMEDKPFYDASGGGVTISGGECLSQPLFTTALARKMKALKISVAIDTCGYVKPEVLDGIAPYTDMFLYDIKAIDPVNHKRLTGVDNTLILNNFLHLHKRGCPIEVRCPFVPGYNDGEFEKIREFLVMAGYKGRVKILGYHRFADGKYTALGYEDKLPDITVLSEDIEKVVTQFKKSGLRAVNGMLDD